MEEQLQKHLDEIVQALNSGIDILGQQAPKLIQEVLTYYTWQSIIVAILFLFLTLVSVYWFFFTKKKYEHQGRFDDWEFGMLLSGIAIIGFLIPLVIQILNLIKIMIAPRLFLIEKVANLI